MLRTLAALSLAAGLATATAALQAPATPASAAGATDLEPGPTAQQAVAIGTGLYDVRVPESGEQYLSVRRTVPGSTIWYSFSADVPTPADGYSALTVTSRADGTGDSCARGNELESLFDDFTQSALQTSLIAAGPGDPCGDADSVLLQVASSDLPAGTYRLLVWEEPPATNADALPLPGPVSWAPLEAPDTTEAVAATPAAPVEAGTSYAEAPVLADGAYTVTLTPGTPALLRFPLTWGQHAQVVATSTTKVDERSSLQARWVSPLGGVLREETYTQGGPTTSEIRLDGTDEPAGWVTPTVAWRDREQAGRYAPAAFAGDYYLSLDLPVEIATGDGDAIALPVDSVEVTLAVRTVTDFAAEAPEYADPPPATPYVDGSSAPADPASGSATAGGAGARDASAGGSDTDADAGGPAGDSGAPVLLVGGLLGVAVLFAAGGAVALGRRRGLR